MIFVEKIIDAGFSMHKSFFDERAGKDGGYRLINGWLGLTTYHPDVSFSKEGSSTELVISLQGLLTGNPITAEDWALVKSMASRYIRLQIGTETIYETFSGVFPPDDIVDKFLQLSK